MIAAHAVMWRNDSTRRFDWLRRFAPLEEQQDVALGDIERGETAIAMHFREAEQTFIETLRTGEVIHVKAGFQNAVHLRHSGPPYKPSRIRRSIETRDAAGSCLASRRRSTYFARMSHSRLT